MEKYNRYRHCLSLIFISIILIGDGIMALDDNSLRTQKDDRISRISYENRRQAFSHIESLPVIGDARAVFK